MEENKEEVKPVKHRIKRRAERFSAMRPVEPQGIEYIVATGLPVKRVVFHDTVLSYGDGPSGIPEFAFYAANAKKSRTAIMWYHALGLLLEQNGKYKIVPLANIKEVDLV